LADDALGLGEQSRAQVAVVIRAFSHEPTGYCTKLSLTALLSSNTLLAMTTSSSTHIPDMSRRSVIVTGPNSGIGRAAASALAGAGARVVLAVRALEKGQAAAAR